MGKRTSYPPGTFSWTDLAASDAAAAGSPMLSVLNGGALDASMFDGAPAHWRPAFTVASVDAALQRVRSLGGTVLAEPLELPDGSVATVRDPQGAVFSVF